MPSYSVEGLLFTKFTDSLDWGAPTSTLRCRPACIGYMSDHTPSMLCCSRSPASGGHVPRRRQRADGRLDHGWSSGGPQSWRARTRRRVEGDGGHFLRQDQGSSIGAPSAPGPPQPPRVQSEGSAVLLSSAARGTQSASADHRLTSHARAYKRLFEPEAGSTPPEEHGANADACEFYMHCGLHLLQHHCPAQLAHTAHGPAP